MNAETLSSSSIRKMGLKALSKALGPVGMVRFLQQFETGIGNYTEERNLWLKETSVRAIVEEIKRKRTRKQKPDAAH